jgi:hypothetical protein
MARADPNSILHISTATLDQIDDYIRDLNVVGRSIRPGMEILTMTLAYTNQSFAQSMSRGPVDPKMTNPKAAWKIPVRRITGRYYKGWKTKRLKPGLWMVYNDSREAYYIEHGIHPTGTKRTSSGGTNFTLRVRRPIGKLSVIRTLRFADSSRVADRVFETVLEPMRPGRTYSKRGSGIAISGMTSRLGYLAGRRI